VVLWISVVWIIAALHLPKPGPAMRFSSKLVPISSSAYPTDHKTIKNDIAPAKAITVRIPRKMGRNMVLGKEKNEFIPTQKANHPITINKSP